MNDDLTGQTIGPYQIHAAIRAGGMAVIHKAQDTRSGQWVAVKVLFPHLKYHPDIVERFHREAKNAAALKHAHIVSVLNDGDLPDGRPYIVMELVEGGDLADQIKNRGNIPFPLPEIDNILTQIASALDYAHQRKVIHRDVKPANILMTSEGQAKLTDFGIARALQDSRLTTDDMRLGSPTYMSPEQTRGMDAGVQSDVYSLGITIYELLTGRVPFQGDSTAVSYQHVHQPPPPLREINPALPPSLEKVINKALEKTPKSRHKSAGKFAAAFHAALMPENYQASIPVKAKKPFPLAPALIIAAIVIVALAITALLGGTSSPHSTPTVSAVSTFIATRTPTPRTPTPTPGKEALRLTIKTPLDNSSFLPEDSISFHWNGPNLKDNQIFRVLVQENSQEKLVASIRTTDTRVSFETQQFTPDKYSWLVIIEEFINGGYQEKARSPIYTFKVIPNPITPTPSATPTPRPRRPTPTPIPIPPPVPLAPQDGDSFVGDIAEVSFQWTPANRPLQANEYYVLIIEHEKGKDFNWLKSPAYTIPNDKRWLMDLGPGFHWQVVVARQRTGEPNENPAGAEISDYSARRFFRWEK